MKSKLYILCGIPFSGKSTLAAKIVDKFGSTRIDLDQIKDELIGREIIESQIDQKSWDRIYTEMYLRIGQALAAGQSVIHDTGNFTVYERSLVSKIASKLNIPFTTIYVDTSTEVAYKRLVSNRLTKSRFNISDKSFYDAVTEMEIPGPSEHTVIYNPNDNLDSWLSKNFK